MSTKKKQKVARWLVDLMVKHYGSIEAARAAYVVVRAEARKRSAGGHGDYLPWVTTDGRIQVAYAADIFYFGSPDAPFALPC